MEKDEFKKRFKWHIIISVAIVAVVIYCALFTDVFLEARVSSLLNLLLFVGGIIVLATIVAILTTVMKMFDTAKQCNIKLEQLGNSVEKMRSTLTQINQTTRISETAKTIAFHESDKQTLQEAVFDRLQLPDFDAAFRMIDDIATCTEYRTLADELRAEAERYKNATTQERINQVIIQIESLLNDHQWIKASLRIERLIKDHPDSDRAKSMRQKLLEKKIERKRILLNAWDDAVKREDTDRSLEILQELDMYLSPNEALALKEAAGDVFRNKLHNLGVQFSLEISEKKWGSALETGKQIVRYFPNSKMAEEIREKLDVLKVKVHQ
ncbi:MAG TPA: hypothetical protein PLP05_01765 [Sedimentisphaerales bacterium]|nr:hypothetical protein [Sedimentisphaerales bacterium]